MGDIIERKTPDEIEVVANEIKEMAKDLDQLKDYSPTAENQRIPLQTDMGLGITIKEFAKQFPEEKEKLDQLLSFIADKMDEIGSIIG